MIKLNKTSLTAYKKENYKKAIVKIIYVVIYHVYKYKKYYNIFDLKFKKTHFAS